MPMSGYQVVCMTDSAKDKLVAWARANALRYTIETDIGEDGVDYIVSLPSEEDVEQYFAQLEASTQ